MAFADGVLDQYVRPIFGVAFLVAALAVLFADSLRRIRSWGPIRGQIGTAREPLWPDRRNGGRVGLTVLAAALVAPVVVPGFGGHFGFDLYSLEGDGRIRVAPFGSARGRPERSCQCDHADVPDPGGSWLVLADDRAR